MIFHIVNLNFKSAIGYFNFITARFDVYKNEKFTMIAYKFKSKLFNNRIKNKKNSMIRLAFSKFQLKIWARINDGEKYNTNKILRFLFLLYIFEKLIIKKY